MNYYEIKEGVNYVRVLNSEDGVFTVNVIDRATGTIKLLKLGNQLAKDFLRIQSNLNWNDISEYDLCITRGPEGHQPQHIVTIENYKPLSEEDKDLVRQYNQKKTIKIENDSPTESKKKAKPFCTFCNENLCRPPNTAGQQRHRNMQYMCSQIGERDAKP